MADDFQLAECMDSKGVDRGSLARTRSMRPPIQKEISPVLVSFHGKARKFPQTSAMFTSDAGKKPASKGQQSHSAIIAHD